MKIDYVERASRMPRIDGKLKVAAMLQVEDCEAVNLIFLVFQSGRMGFHCTAHWTWFCAICFPETCGEGS